MTVTITGRVYGVVKFPENPEYEGHLGLVGGEDVCVTRTTFRSIGEAMTWCRKVLDGKIKSPHWIAEGKLLDPYTEPTWSTARVTWAAPGGVESDHVFEAEAGSDRQWYVEEGLQRGVAVRTDPV